VNQVATASSQSQKEFTYLVEKIEVLRGRIASGRVCPIVGNETGVIQIVEQSTELVGDLERLW
jgi:hypothetical protein